MLINDNLIWLNIGFSKLIIIWTVLETDEDENVFQLKLLILLSPFYDLQIVKMFI